MKTLIITLIAAGAVVTSYFGVRYFTRKDLGFTRARVYFRNLAENLLHIEATPARKAE